MQPPAPPGHRWTSLPEASRILNLPETTLRNMVRDGKIEGGQYPRNPDNPEDRRNVWRILVPIHQDEDAVSESEHPPAPAPDPQPSSTWLQDRLVERDETIAGLYVEVRVLAERAARAEAALDGANARAEQYALDYGEQMERAIKAEREAAELRARIERRRWYDPRTW